MIISDLVTINELAAIIKANHNMYFQVDNDAWLGYESEEDYNAGADPIVESDDVEYSNNGYGSGSSYGGDILQALAIVADVTVESV